MIILGLQGTNPYQGMTVVMEKQRQSEREEWNENTCEFRLCSFQLFKTVTDKKL